MIRKILITGLVLSCFIQAQYRDIPDVVTKVATATANWLKIETGVRAIGMGALLLQLVQEFPLFPTIHRVLDFSLTVKPTIPRVTF